MPIVTISRESYTQAEFQGIIYPGGAGRREDGSQARLSVHLARSPDRGFRRVQRSGDQTSPGDSRCSSRPRSIHVREGAIYRLYTRCPAAAIPWRQRGLSRTGGPSPRREDPPRSQGQDHRRSGRSREDRDAAPGGIRPGVLGYEGDVGTRSQAPGNTSADIEG